MHDDLDSGMSKHPEISGLESEPVLPETKAKLLEEVIDKVPEAPSNPDAVTDGAAATYPGIFNPPDVGRAFRYPGEQMATLNVRRIKEGRFNEYRPERVATLTLTEEVDGRDPDLGKIYTHYFINQVPDGLMMEKETSVRLPHPTDTLTSQDIRAMSPEESGRLLGAVATDRLKELAQERAAEKLGHELGMTFVSEEEAQSLLSLLEDTVPMS